MTLMKKKDKKLTFIPSDLPEKEKDEILFRVFDIFLNEDRDERKMRHEIHSQNVFRSVS